jgi:transposase
MKNLTFEELLDKLEKALARIEALEKENKLLREENAMLRARLNMNSSNSSLPPSSDRFIKKKDRSLRKKSNKASGGQVGHKGSTLDKIEKPDFVVDLEIDTCPHCKTNLENTKIEDIKVRQVFDIPEIKILVTEYRSQVKICPHCREKAIAKFPSNVTSPTQYGANIRALITNLNIYHALPYNKIQELLKDIFNLNLSQGTIANTLKKAYVSLEKVENFFKEELKKASILHADETGTKINGKNHWIHSCSNEKYSVLTSHPNRGKKAIEEADILPNFNGILSHDCWYAYDCYPQIVHSLCWAHFLRELQSIEENTTLEFPSKIREFILNLKEKVENKEEFSIEEEISIWLEYMKLIEDGSKEERTHYQTDVLEPKKRKSKAFNLLKRLSRYEDVLRFFIERKISLFTNNAAEREVRNIKVKSKIQGTFRSELGSQIYCRIRGYISTMKKNEKNQYAALKSIFDLCEIMLPIVK